MQGGGKVLFERIVISSEWMSHTESFYKQLILKMSYVFKTYLKSKFQQNWTVKNWSKIAVANSNRLSQNLGPEE